MIELEIPRCDWRLLTLVCRPFPTVVVRFSDSFKYSLIFTLRFKKAREGIEPPSTESESVVITATLTGRALKQKLNVYILESKPNPIQAQPMHGNLQENRGTVTFERFLGLWNLFAIIICRE